MRLFKKIAKCLALACFCLAAALAIALYSIDAWLPSMATAYVHSKTQFKVLFERFHCSPLQGELSLEGVQLTNPPSYEQPHFVYLNKFYVKAPLLQWIAQEKTIDTLEVDVAKIDVVRSKQGDFNALTFAKSVQQLVEEHTSSPSKAEEPAEAAAPTRWLIHQLTLKLGSVCYSDNKAGFTSKEQKLNYVRTFTDVSDLQQVALAVEEDLKGEVADIVIQSLLSPLLPQNLLKGDLKDLLKAGEGLKKEVKKQLDNLLQLFSPQ